ELQPSFEVVLPSSQVSLPATMPSPHWPATHAASGVGQDQPFSIWQVELQPSPDTSFPSSHASPVSTMPSPHVIFVHLPPFGVPPSPAPASPALPTGHSHPGSTWQVDE